MLEHEKDRQLNALLDSFLSTYSAVEPRAGLDTRIRAGLRVRAARRRRRSVLILAVTAAAVILAALIASLDTRQPSIPDHVVAHKSSPDPVSVHAGTVTLSPQKTGSQIAVDRRAKVRNSTNSLVLLQAANALHGADSMVFEQEKLYLSPAPQPEPEPAIEPQAPAPTISIRDLGVQTIEIKDLPSAKGMDSKGNYL
jgi:hypothetical protein